MTRLCIVLPNVLHVKSRSRSIPSQRRAHALLALFYRLYSIGMAIEQRKYHISVQLSDVPYGDATVSARRWPRRPKNRANARVAHLRKLREATGGGQHGFARARAEVYEDFALSWLDDLQNRQEVLNIYLWLRQG